MGAGVIRVINPADEREISRVPVTAVSELESMVRKAREAQSLWERIPYSGRLKLFGKLKHNLQFHHEYWLESVQLETGKVWQDAMGDVVSAVKDIKYTEQSAPRIEKEEKERGNVREGWPLGNYRGRIKSRAKVVGVITPFNLPLAIPAADIFPAIFKGKAVIWKPSEYTPLTAITLAAVMEEIGFPENLLQVAVGCGDLGAALCEKVDSLIFTGSEATGRKVEEICRRRGIFCGSEKSGIAPFVVLSDADLELAANAACYGLAGNLGQYCKAPRHAIVARSVYGDFVDLLLNKAGALRDGIDYGPFIAKFQREKVEAQIEDARARKACIAIGGCRVSGREKGYWYRPAVILRPSEDMRVMQEEVFGPVLTVESFGSDDEAVRLANRFPQGLNASVFTKDEKRFEKIADGLEIGNVVGNDIMVNWLINGLPQCGLKGSALHASGLPRHGRTGFDRFDFPYQTETWREHPFMRLPQFRRVNLWWPPYKKFSKLALKAFLFKYWF